MQLTRLQIESLYEMRQRSIASQRAAFVDDLLVGMSCLGSNGDAIKEHMRILLAVASGRSESLAGPSPTNANVVAL